MINTLAQRRDCVSDNKKAALAFNAIDYDKSVVNDQEQALTLLMCDIVDSTRMSVELSAQEMRSLLIAYYTTCAQQIDHNHGRMIQCVGDGVLAVFDKESATDVNALNAAITATELTQQIPESLQSHSYIHRKVSVRVCVASGLGIPIYSVPMGQELIFGQLPFIASRLQQAAKPNTVIFNALAAKLIGSRLNLVKLGSLHLRGFAQRVRAWTLDTNHQPDCSTAVFTDRVYRQHCAHGIA